MNSASVSAKFLYELLRQADVIAADHGIEPITTVCGIAQILRTTSEQLVRGESPNPMMAWTLHGVLTGSLGNHIRQHHPQHQAVMRQAMAIPHVSALADQIQAAHRNRIRATTATTPQEEPVEDKPGSRSPWGAVAILMVLLAFVVMLCVGALVGAGALIRLMW